MSKRQEEKKRAKLLKETYFLINWSGEEEADLYDVVPAKDVVPSEDSDVLEIKSGESVRVVYESKYYKAQVLNIGTSLEMRKSLENGKLGVMDLIDGARCANVAYRSESGDDAYKSADPGKTHQIYDVNNDERLPPEMPVQVKTDPKPQKDPIDAVWRSQSESSDPTVSHQTSDEHNDEVLPPKISAQVKADPKSRKRKTVSDKCKEKNKKSKKEFFFQFDSGSDSDKDKENFEPIDLSFTEESLAQTPNRKVTKSAALDMQREWQKKHFTEESGKNQEEHEKSTADLLKDLQERILSLEETTKKLTKKLKAQGKELELLKLNPRPASSNPRPVSSNPVLTSSVLLYTTTVDTRQ